LYHFHNNKLEVIWTIVPSIVLTFLVLRGFNTWSKITTDIPKDSQEIEVFAYQFGWKARYAGDDKELGNSNFNFISGTNPLGIAEDAAIKELVVELEGEVEKIKLKQQTASDSIKVWKAKYDRMVSTGLNRTYPEEFKAVKDQYNDAISGSYERQLEKDLKRKKTALSRITEYHKDKDFFNGKASDDKITTEIVLVKDKPYLFKFRARDVIHSAYMPDFRVQMNCVPGMPTQFAFTPVITTAEAREFKNNAEFDYYLFCNNRFTYFLP
jgi:cytochrome c oxidase subunit 2